MNKQKKDGVLKTPSFFDFALVKSNPCAKYLALAEENNKEL